MINDDYDDSSHNFNIKGITYVDEEGNILNSDLEIIHPLYYKDNKYYTENTKQWKRNNAR